MTDSLPPGVAELIPDYLARQRWYASSAPPEALDIHRCGEVVGGDGPRLLQAIVGAGEDRYQLLIGERPNGQVAEFLRGHEPAVLGEVGGHFYYDGVLDPELALELLPVVTGGAERAARVRPITAEQTNTSLVYDDRIILKVFRRLLAGTNPDVEVTTALAGAGFEHVAAPVAVWAADDDVLAFAQRYLAGGSEGWALALTSLRDLYASGSPDPGVAGGDFAYEARRLGRITAEMHLAMAMAFGVEREGDAAGRWPVLVDSIENRLRAVPLHELEERVESFVSGLRGVASPGPALRVHGDYHLGQVMWTDQGWYVLDFEGEPARPLEERTRPSSPLKDVAGMLRSFHYASRAAMWDWEDDEQLEFRAEAWEQHNRAAFLDAYLSTSGIADLLPETREEVLAAYELDKALYELAYETMYRPDWAVIPLRAIIRLLERG